jgi:hypothetical protein
MLGTGQDLRFSRRGIFAFDRNCEYSQGQKELNCLIEFVDNFDLCNLYNKSGYHDVFESCFDIRDHYRRRHVIVEI